MRSLIFTTILIATSYCCNSKITQEKETEQQIIPEITFNGTLKVLTLNTWQEGTSVNGGFEAIVEVILLSEADVVTLSEIRNYNDTVFSNRLVNALELKGEAYYSFNSGKSPIILSKFPITSKPAINSSSFTKAIIKLDEKTKVAVYAAHLDYTHYACYLPRGYDGITWEKLPEPILDVHKILEQNKASRRDEAINLFVNDAAKEQQNGNIVLLAGDFNEPSHLDWIEATKDLFDHNGTIVPWHSSVTLQQNKYLDAYRVKYPNPVTHPGFTWAAYNINVELSKLVWTPEADDRDRIDFIYYHKNERLALKDIIIVGPSESIVRGNGVQDNTLFDTFLKPQGIWPTDHKGVLATFKIK
ncbi:endonuclease/exonuclease/phosphatase family protein [Wocania ichthyoenteri]|uniref:endonuclease/exonuclease/phosphatase family protein n=1 Tax=Wocania ichthyoenteri TaxID=1230531 RepID=UPI00053D1B2C|nr:endonuclease/exonuclease/phosphatase family protein [Wocania ichthyoenteri]